MLEHALLDYRLLAVPAGVLVLILVRLAVFIWPKSSGVVKKRPALPGRGYTLIYADKPDDARIRMPGVTYSKLLRDPRHHVQGKPDMLYARGQSIIPVELKSGKIGDAPLPREGDMMQLAVYFWLVEAEYGLRPREGRLIYSDSMFVIYNTKPLRWRLAQILAQMEEIADAVENEAMDPAMEAFIPPAEPAYKKCLHCPCRGTVCEAAP